MFTSELNLLCLSEEYRLQVMSGPSNTLDLANFHWDLSLETVHFR